MEVSECHPSPVARSSSTSPCRPGAEIVSRSGSPRTTAAGRSSNRIAGSNVPRQASTGRITARSPSLNVGVNAPSETADPSATTASCIMRRVAAPRVTGNNVREPCARRDDKSAAARRPSAPVSATSSVPRTDPARSDCSRSTSSATLPMLVCRRTSARVNSSAARLAPNATTQTTIGIPRGKANQRAPPSRIAASATMVQVAATISAIPPSRYRARSLARSRSTSCKIVTEPLGWWSRRRTNSRPFAAQLRAAPADRCTPRCLPTRFQDHTRNRRTPQDDRQ